MATVAVEDVGVGGKVIGHAVEDQVHAAVLGGAAQFFEDFHRCFGITEDAQIVVYEIKGASVVAMVRRRLKDGVEVDGGDAQFLQIVELFDDAL